MALPSRHTHTTSIAGRHGKCIQVVVATPIAMAQVPIARCRMPEAGLAGLAGWQMPGARCQASTWHMYLT